MVLGAWILSTLVQLICNWDASLNCYEVIKESWQEAEGLLAIKEGLAELTRNFKLASKFHDTNEERSNKLKTSANKERCMFRYFSFIPKSGQKQGALHLGNSSTDSLFVRSYGDLAQRIGGE